MKKQWLKQAFGIATLLFCEDFDTAKWLEKYNGEAATALTALNNLRMNEAEKFKEENSKARAAKRTESERAETLETRVKELEGKVPVDGVVTLSLEDAKVYQALLNGKNLTEFKAAYEAGLNEVETAKQAKASLSHL
jgi:hypothetical protein